MRSPRAALVDSPSDRDTSLGVPPSARQRYLEKRITVQSEQYAAVGIQVQVIVSLSALELGAYMCCNQSTFIIDVVVVREYYCTYCETRSNTTMLRAALSSHCSIEQPAPVAYATGWQFVDDVTAGCYTLKINRVIGLKM